jgi:hypothetical protein
MPLNRKRPHRVPRINGIVCRFVTVSGFEDDTCSCFDKEVQQIDKGADAMLIALFVFLLNAIFLLTAVYVVIVIDRVIVSKTMSEDRKGYCAAVPSRP